MHEPPVDLSDAEVLAVVRRHWSFEVDAVEHLQVGFGAHHWRACAGYRPLFFVTYDRLGDDLTGARHTPESLEAAYGAAAELAFHLDFVVAGLPSEALTYTVPVASGALSVTPWVVGERPVAESDEAVATAAMLARLHATHPPSGLPRWTPVTVHDLDLDETWTGGPLSTEAQALLRGHHDDVRRWGSRHAQLAELASDRPWVITHGEPHHRNQLITVVRTLLVDWESVRLAPRERDLLTLARIGHLPTHADLPDADPEMLELFDLEWRLDEIQQYAAWLAAPHTGTADDHESLAGLRDELERAEIDGVT